jgi:hypothetical protein
MPSQTQIFFDNNTLYTRYDASGTNSGAGGAVGVGTTISYYGYSTPGVADTSNNFSIKKTYYIGNIQYIDWSNNIPGAFESSWTNRNFYFATPSNITITGTSFSNSLNSYNVTFTWTAATGSSRYNVTLTRDNGTIFNIQDAGGDQYNPYGNSGTRTLVNTLTLTLANCSSGHTYSASVFASNGAGVSSTVTANVKL